MEFPTTNLYELEGRVFTDTWSIPYKRDESLGKCLIAAAKLAEEGKTVVTLKRYHSTLRIIQQRLLARN